MKRHTLVEALPLEAALMLLLMVMLWPPILTLLLVLLLLLPPCSTIRDTTTTPAHVTVPNTYYPGGVVQVIGKVLIPNLAPAHPSG
jgi:hypothetical protein